MLENSAIIFNDIKNIKKKKKKVAQVKKKKLAIDKSPKKKISKTSASYNKKTSEVKIKTVEIPELNELVDSSTKDVKKKVRSGPKKTGWWSQ
jgi:hypothetical protein